MSTRQERIDEAKVLAIAKTKEAEPVPNLSAHTREFQAANACGCKPDFAQTRQPGF
jgi:hypothetical protein